MSVSTEQSPLYDDEMIYDKTVCKICNNAISEHSSSMAVDCALAIIKGEPSP